MAEKSIKDTNGALGLIGFSAFNYPNKSRYSKLICGTQVVMQLMILFKLKILTQTASANAPTALTTDGALWYNSIVDEVDIMVHDGTTWKGYLNVYSSS